MTRRATVLVVDHEPPLLDLVRAVLHDAGYRVVTTTRPEDALVALRAFRCALVLAGTCASAVRAGDDPWAAVEQIKVAAGDTPVAICTAHDPHVYADFRKRGYAGLIATPFDLDALPELIARLIGESSRADLQTFVRPVRVIGTHPAL